MKAVNSTEDCPRPCIVVMVEDPLRSNLARRSNVDRHLICIEFLTFK